MLDQTHIIAHRGLSGKCLENTAQAFDLAWQQNCDGIELDIQVSEDKKILVFHDPDTQRVSDKNYPKNHIISETNWSVLKDIPLQIKTTDNIDHSTNPNIVLLPDVINGIPKNKIVQIELKHQFDNDESLKAVIDYLSQIRTDIVVQIISFDLHKLYTVKQACPNLCCLYLLPEDLPTEADKLANSLQNYCDLTKQHQFEGVGLHHKYLTQETVELIKKNQLLIDTWTVNCPKIAQKLIELQVDFIASDVADDIHAEITHANKI